MEEFINELKEEEINNYDDFSRLYNKLENSIYLDRVSAKSHMTEEEAHVVYENNEHKVELIAKFNEPEYYNIVIH